MSSTWNFYSAARLLFGTGAASQLGPILARRGFSRVLIVTDETLVGLGVASEVGGSLREASIDVEVFSDGQAEPSIEAAIASIARAREVRPDAVLGLGGGSNMDLAKFTVLGLAHGGEPADYFGFDNVPGPVAPLVCVPTTSGTGSEVSHAAVLTDTANEMKVSCLSNFLRPAWAVVDPLLTHSCPPKVTADSGIDALTHAIEAYTAIDHAELSGGSATGYDGSHPLGDCLAERAIELIGRHLPIAVADPQDAAAREGMSLGATIAGLAFSNCGVAVVHALEYPLGGTLHCSHGAGNGLLLPYVMRYNLKARQSRFARVAALLGEDVANLGEREAAERAVQAVEKLRAQIGIPQRIRDIGGREEQLPQFAAKSIALTRLMKMNPRTPTEADLLGILREAL